MNEVTLERFDEVAEFLYRKSSAEEMPADALAAQVAFSALLRQKLFGSQDYTQAKEARR